MPTKARKPTPKQLRFCQEYVVDHNATAAYVRAGYSENGASQAAYKLLRNTYILAVIERLEAAKARRMEVTQDAVLREARENLTKPNIQSAIAGRSGPHNRAPTIARRSRTAAPQGATGRAGEGQDGRTPWPLRGPTRWAASFDAYVLRSGEHDDLALAVALAVWAGSELKAG